MANTWLKVIIRFVKNIPKRFTFEYSHFFVPAQNESNSRESIQIRSDIILSPLIHQFYENYVQFPNFQNDNSLYRVLLLIKVLNETLIP